MNVFAEIYDSDSWTNGSGPGSHPAACQPLIRFLDRFIADNKVTSIVDFGCGDWQFMSNLELTGKTYVGLDVVDSVLSLNTERHLRPGVGFARTPDDLSMLPRADLLLLKDVLIHLPNSYISDLIKQLGKYKYVVAINNTANDNRYYNTEIEFGGFRPVDLTMEPFSRKCATVLRFGQARILDPRLHPSIAFALRRFIWPGEKHVQLLFGDGGRADLK